MQGFAYFLLSLIVLAISSSFGIFNLLDSGAWDKAYIFDPTALHTLARSAIDQHGNDTKALVASIVSQLRADESIGPYLSVDEEWMFNNAGGAMGAMYIIHASISEYLLIFGTAIGTEGHTGRHTADDYFNILHGTQVAYKAGSYEAEVYPPGSVHHLRRGEVKHWKMDDSCFALEYARGFIPGMFAFGYADALSSTMDFPTLWTMTRVTAREMVGNLIRGKF